MLRYLHGRTMTQLETNDDARRTPFYLKKAFWAVSLLYVLANAVIWVNTDAELRLQYAGDGASWYQPSVGLYEYGAFVLPNMPDEPSVYRPPMFPLFAAAMFGLFGETTPNAIAFGQIILLFVAGCFFRSSVEDWLPGWGTAGMAVFLFNPNVLTISQYTQSDTVFLFFMTLTLWAVLRFAGGDMSWRQALLTGACLACACLTRPTAQFLIVVLPLVFPLLAWLGGSARNVGRGFLQGMIAMLLAIVVVSPWALYVQSVDGQFGLSDSQSRYRFVWDQIVMLEAHSNGRSYHQAAQYLERDPDGTQARLAREYGPGWETLSDRERHFYLTDKGFGVLLSYPPGDLAKSYFRSIVQFLTAGGSGRLRYLLDSDPEHAATLWFKTEQNAFIRKLAEYLSSAPPLAIAASVIGLGFVAIARLFGIIGIVTLMRRREWALLCTLVGVVSYFAFVHLFVGNSRYRVVTEPALMFFFLFGLRAMWSAWRDRRGMTE